MCAFSSLMCKSTINTIDALVRAKVIYTFCICNMQKFQKLSAAYSHLKHKDESLGRECGCVSCGEGGLTVHKHRIIHNSRKVNTSVGLPLPKGSRQMLLHSITTGLLNFYEGEL